MTYRNDWLRRAASRMFCAGTMERVIDPILADIATEHERAVGQGRLWVSRWIRVAGHVTLFKVFALCAFDRGLQNFRNSTPDDRLAVGRIIGCSAAAIAGTTLLLLLPIALRQRARLSPQEMAYFPQLMAYVIPSQLALTLPIGCSLGILYGLRGLTVSLRSKIVVLVFSIACAGATFMTTAWLMPAANQGFRELAYAAQVRQHVPLPYLPPKGAPEMTFRELTQRIEAATRDGLLPRAAWQLSFNYHFRWALSGWTLVIALFSLALVTRLNQGRFILGAAAFAAYLGCWILLAASRAGALRGTLTLPAAFAAWLPNIVLGLVALALLKLPPRKTAGPTVRSGLRSTELLTDPIHE